MTLVQMICLTFTYPNRRSLQATVKLAEPIFIFNVSTLLSESSLSDPSSLAWRQAHPTGDGSITSASCTTHARLLAQDNRAGRHQSKGELICSQKTSLAVPP